MPYYVVCYPQLAAPDRRWIDEIRRNHDPQAALIAPHITLVFGLMDIGEAVLARHIASCAEAQTKIEVRFSALECHRGVNEEAFYAFLLPDQGRAEVEALHHALHGGPLLRRGRAMPAFVPHITLGRSGDPDAIRTLIAAQRLPGGGISARLDALTLVALDGGTLRPIAEAAFCG